MPRVFTPVQKVKRNALSAKWRAANPLYAEQYRTQPAVIRRDFAFRLYKKYHITREEYAGLAVAQSGLCAICAAQMTDAQTDHDHDFPQVRGLLCGDCNLGIGRMGDDPVRLERAAAYLRAAEARLPVAV